MTICRKLREEGNHTPILVLTAKGELADKVDGLNSGADEAVGPLTTTADNSTADQAYTPMVLYNTGLWHNWILWHDLHRVTVFILPNW